MRSWALRLAGILAVLALASCGGDDDGGDSETGGSATESAEIAIYDWERNLIPNPAAPGSAERGSARPPEVQAIGGAEPIVVRDESEPEHPRYFALRDRPALTGAEIAAASAEIDPTTGEPSIALELTADGQRQLETLTKAVAERRAGDHIAIVVDDELLSLPVIDHRQFPQGFEGEQGLQISGGFTQAEAEELAERLSPDG